jgi:DNA-binding PadR family transcriptional regulator
VKVLADNDKNTANKLLLLYLIDKMELPLSNSQITEYVRQAEFMDYITLCETLADMTDKGYLEKTVENNNTRYTITDEGQTTLEYFEKHIPAASRGMVNSYVRDSRSNIKKYYENTANFFPNAENNEFIVKCGLYEDDRALMEFSISVDTRDQARQIQTNWKANANILYGRIIESLTVSPVIGEEGEPEESEEPEETTSPSG